MAHLDRPRHSSELISDEQRFPSAAVRMPPAPAAAATAAFDDATRKSGGETQKYNRQN